MSIARPKRARQATRRSWTSDGDAHLGHLVEDLRRHGQQADQRRPGAGAEHHLERALEGEDLGVEAGAGDDVGEQVLDVVEHAGLGHRVREVEDLLLEQELFFVVKHGSRMVAPGFAWR